MKYFQIPAAGKCIKWRWLFSTVGLLLAVACAPFLSANETIVSTDNHTIAIRDAKIVTQPGQVIEKGTIVIRNGLIEAVGTNVDVPYDAQEFDGTGLVVYAGFIGLRQLQGHSRWRRKWPQDWLGPRST